MQEDKKQLYDLFEQRAKVESRRFSAEKVIIYPDLYKHFVNAESLLAGLRFKKLRSQVLFVYLLNTSLSGEKGYKKALNMFFLL